MASEMPVVNAEFGDRPTIEFPTEIAPAGLKVVELFEGNGPMVRRGDTVTVNYHGVVWGKDTPFDSSFARHPRRSPRPSIPSAPRPTGKRSPEPRQTRH